MRKLKNGVNTPWASAEWSVIVSAMSPKYISDFNDPIFTPFHRRSNCRQRILVAEDEPGFRQLTAEELTDAGYQVDVAEDGATAWTAMQIHQYDLLFTDQFLPKVSGIELLKKIHAARLPLPVIMATGFLPTWEFTLHPGRQPVKMLVKPYSFGKLLGLVKNVLSKSGGMGDDLPLPPLPPEPTLPPLSQLFAW
jgi:DNA-binding response OmpR family regulator